MSFNLAETLPLVQRLALSYAPHGARAPALGVLALDNRLAGILRGGGEPMLAQIKLAWWRERLEEDPANWPEGEPLLAALRDFPEGPGKLAGMVGGWETLLADELDRPAIVRFAEGRASGWQALGGGEAARQWALADLLLNMAEGGERGEVRAALAAEGWSRSRLPRGLRPLAILHALTGRAVRRGSAELLDGPGALATAMRVGLFGS